MVEQQVAQMARLVGDLLDVSRLGSGGLELALEVVDLAAVVDAALREYLQNLPTSFALSDEAVDRVRAAAAQVLRESPAFQRFVASLAQ